MLHGDQNGLAEHLPAFNTLLCSQNGLETVLLKLYRYSTGFPALKRPCQSLTSIQQALLNSELAQPLQAADLPNLHKTVLLNHQKLSTGIVVVKKTGLTQGTD